jgi:hypothetical protein
VNVVVTPFAGTVNVASWRVWTLVSADTLTARVTLSVRVCNTHSYGITIVQVAVEPDRAAGLVTRSLIGPFGSATTTAVALHWTGTVAGIDVMSVIVPVIFSVPVTGVLAAAIVGEEVVAISGRSAPVCGSRNPMTEGAAPDRGSSAQAETAQARPIRPAQSSALEFMCDLHLSEVVVFPYGPMLTPQSYGPKMRLGEGA